MGFRIEERFVVKAPVEPVWQYLIDPRRVVTCLPGAELGEVIDERTFTGAVKVKVGAITVSFKGKVHLGEVDEAARSVKMSGEGRESGGTGSAKMGMESRLTALPGGGTEVVVLADVDVVGRLVQLGRGMIQQVSHQLFLQFSECVRRTLEAEAAAQVAAGVAAAGAGAPLGSPVVSPAAAGAATAGAGFTPGREAAGPAGTPAPRPPAPLAHRAEPVRALPLLFKAFAAWMAELFRRIFGARRT